MIGMTLADLRESWRTWLGVSLTFVTASFGWVLVMLTLDSLSYSGAHNLLTAEETELYGGVLGAPTLPFALTMVPLVNTAARLVIAARRGHIARLSLAGATPRQVVSLVMGQVAIVSVVCSLAGALLATVLLPPVLWLCSRAGDPIMPLITARYAPSSYLWGVLITMLVSLLGCWKQARHAARIPPVEALRAANAGTARRHGWFRWLMMGVGVIVIAGLFYYFGMTRWGDDAWVTKYEPVAFKTQLQALGLLALFMPTLIVLTIAEAAPLTIAGLTRAWTGLVPRRAVTWHVAREIVATKANRLTGVVTPLMVAIALPTGLMAALNTAMDGLATGTGMDASGVKIEAMAVLVGLPLLLGVASALGGLIMMGRQREAELALCGVLGATPRQQARLSVLEGVIIVVTSTALAMVTALLSGLWAWMAAHQLGWMSDFVFPWGVFGWTFLGLVVVGAAATALPSLPTLREPAPRVISRLVDA